MMSKYFTGTGDDGFTGQLGEGKIPKYHPRIEAVGDLDEAVAIIGVIRASAIDSRLPGILLKIQRSLYVAMTEVSAAKLNADKFNRLTVQDIDWLEKMINEFGSTVELPSDFIVPGDSINGARLAHARTVSRRAERRVAQLFHEGDLVDSTLLTYLNRLSSLLFILELVENKAFGGQNPTLAKHF